MTNPKFDKLFQDKLNDLQCEYKSDYWKDMKNVINSSSLSTVASSATRAASSSMSTLTIATISTVGVAIIAAALYFFNTNKSTDDNEIIIVEEHLNIENNSQANNSNTKKIEISQNNNIETNIETTIATEEIINTNNTNTLNNNSNPNITKASKQFAVEETDLFTEPNINLINTDITTNCNEIIDIDDIVIDELDDYTINNLDITEADVKEEIIPITSESMTNYSAINKRKHAASKIDISKEEIKVDNSEVKNVKPMRKPTGKIFKRRGGLFKRSKKK